MKSNLLNPIGGFVDGAWIGASETGETFEVINPATGVPLARLPNMGARETVAAIEAAARSLAPEEPAEERRRWLLEIHDRLLASKEDFARIITGENGKPLAEARVEVDYTCGFFRFVAEELHRTRPEPVPGRMRGCAWTIHHRPAGVVGLIAPWNFPLAMLGKKVAPALATGCASVVKPARQTPLSMLALARLAVDAGVPRGRLNVVVGSATPIGETLCTHPDVRLVSFTGSTEVGEWLARRCAPHLKRTTLELGGNAPFVVFDDANLDAAADALVANKFRAAGQTCVCTNRVLVQEGAFEPFTRRVAERVRRLRVRNGMDPEADVGPLIDRAQYEKVAEHVRDALRRGARRLVGDETPPLARDWGAFFPPTVLSGVTRDMLVSREETFGPVVAIATFASEAEAIGAANDTCYGLAAYLFSNDPARLQRLVPRLRFGHVGLNTATGPTPEAPFGGFKRSGYGREGGVEGLLEFCESQVVAHADSLDRTRA
ncbi:MAG: NAD-dependent succinate-semialdehyde dehydrogenase [Verrucomicrobiales bacterium]|nr:NAD-dependent succinate-semialdehyde dehydrogenase [Verrucomicrobiales bacterium]